MANDPTPVQQYLAKEFEKARRVQRGWQTESRWTCGCWFTTIAALVVLLVAGYFRLTLDSSITIIAIFLVIAVFSLALSHYGSLRISRAVSSVFDQYRDHVESILIERGLLAIILDPDYDEKFDEYLKSKYPIRLALPLPPEKVRDLKMKNRLEVLSARWEEYCEFLKEKPYPSTKNTFPRPLIMPSPDKLARMGIAFVLYRHLVPSRAETAGGTVAAEDETGNDPAAERD